MAFNSPAKGELFTTRIERNSGALTVHARGELDAAFAPVLRGTLLHAFDTDPMSAIILELSGVTFIDLDGVRVLVWAAERSASDGDRLRIRCGSKAVLKVIEEADVAKVLPLAS